MKDLIIIGGGAAGLSAAVYAQSKQLDFAVIYQEVGGKTGREQYISQRTEAEYLAGAEAVLQFERRITATAGIALRDRALEIKRAEEGHFIVETQLNGVLETQTIVIATGASPIKLDIPGARQFISSGIGYSITTHAQLISGRNAAIIGATDRAALGAIELSRTAARVYVVVPQPSASDSELLGKLSHFPNVTLLRGYAPREVLGQTAVEQLIVERDGEIAYLRVHALFADLGLLPNSGVVRGLVELDPRGFIVVDPFNAASVPGIFGAGDCTTRIGEHTMIAIGEGARAAQSAYRHVLANLANKHQAVY